MKNENNFKAAAALPETPENSRRKKEGNPQDH